MSKKWVFVLSLIALSSQTMDRKPDSSTYSNNVLLHMGYDSYPFAWLQQTLEQD